MHLLADFLRRAAGLLLSALLLAMGLVFFISLLAAALLLALAWALRALWAKASGRPVSPWVLRVDPRSGFGAAFRAGRRWPARGPGRAHGDGAAPPAQNGAPPRYGAADDDVTDVEPRDKR